MIRKYPLFLFILCLSISLFSSSIYANENEYQKSLRILKSVKSFKDLFNFDYRKFREDFFNTPEMEKELQTIGQKLQNDFDKAWNEHDNQLIIELGQKILDKDFTDARTHILLAQTFGKIGEKGAQAFHSIIGNELNQSILKSGDGKSFDTAWEVFQVKEEYHFLKSLGYFEVVSQRLLNHEDSFYDLLKAKHYETGEVKEFYFNVTKWYVRLQKHISANTEKNSF